MSLTATEVMDYFQHARRNGHTAINNTCDCCGRGGCGVFATAYRERELLRQRRDPGNICAACAAINDIVIGRIIAESATH